MSQIPAPNIPPPPIAPLPPRRGPGLWVVLGALGIGAVVVIALVAAGGGSGDDKGTGSAPAVALQDFVKAIQTQDCTAIVDGLSAGYVRRMADSDLADGEGSPRERALAACRSSDMSSAVARRLQVGRLVSQDGDTAVVELRRTSGDLTDTKQVKLVREKGEWKVDLPPDLSGPTPSTPTTMIPPPKHKILVTESMIEQCSLPPDVVDSISPQADQDRYRQHCLH